MPMRRPDLTFRPADPGDRGFVRDVSTEVFARFGDYATLLPPLVESPWVRTTVALEDGVPVGFAMLALDDLPLGELDLVAIAVLPGRQRRGVATRLLCRLETEIRELPVGDGLVLRLTVAEDNAPARELFRRAGFVRTPGEHGRYSGGQRSLGMRKIFR